MTKAVKKTVIPPPTTDHDNKDVHEVTSSLWDKEPAFTQIKQAPGIANCPVPSILGALAFTSVGRDQIKGMVSEKAGNVSTDLSSVPSGTLSNPPPGNTISSKRYFKVNVDKGSAEVSDVLYTDDHDSGWSPFYLRDPNEKCIWAAIIEKGLAAKLGGYEHFDADNVSANDFWEKLTGARPDVLEIKADTPSTRSSLRPRLPRPCPPSARPRQTRLVWHLSASFTGFRCWA